ncbi:hypothetical protein DPMN_170725 [Dreissena polymorpha]|uniref:Uncharacterized protein n=1 Tax=Dreissena polymorpha TaxID=45954 RepID=A0A9D4DXJ7_DREPO|nr:hypothetical protein DPMN_170725 [Dreissena polymorpha]
MAKARSEGERASLEYDKLQIDYATLTVDKFPLALHPNCHLVAPRPSIKMQAGKPITEHRVDLESQLESATEAAYFSCLERSRFML